ncbi:hypothetical protein TNCV_4995801 [Trichonephila clavipes]|nr:hypothetical protein TNCV_4995801 [Trichonephila clavipes]
MLNAVGFEVPEKTSADCFELPRRYIGSPIPINGRSCRVVIGVGPVLSSPVPSSSAIEKEEERLMHVKSIKAVMYLPLEVHPSKYQRELEVTICNGQNEDDHDDMGLMDAHEFADLENCEEPPPPIHGALMCSKHKKKKDKYVCKVQCDSGYQFPNGKTKARHQCDIKTGKWTPTFIFPDCVASCEPPCANGGECSEGNHCICTPQFRGDRCQYDLALCDPNRGLHVLGDWKCNHTNIDTTCVLNCPQGTRYESQPAELYTCSLDGTWTPSFAPNCIPINIIEPPAAQSFYSISSGEPVQSKRPSSSVCATWSASHYRTFDGGVYSFTSPCSYLFAKDCEQDTFAIHILNGKPCVSVSDCSTEITIYIGSEMYLLTNGENGPIIKNQEKEHPVPSAVNGMLFQMLSDYVTVGSPLGFKLKWNRKNTILVEVSNQLKNKTCGLCGKFDYSVLNDFGTSDGSITDSVEGFVNSWAMELLGGNSFDPNMPKSQSV